MSLAAPDRPIVLAAQQPPQPIRPIRFTRGDAGLLVGSALAGVCLVWLVFDQMTLLSGAEGFVLCAYVAGLAFYGVTSTMTEGWGAAKDRMVTVVLWTAAVVMLTPLVLVVGYVIQHGYHYLGWHYFVKDDKGVGPLTPPTAAGGLHAIIGTLEQNGLAVLIGGPLAIMTAVFLNEVGGPFTQSVRTVVTAMSGIPSIVAGLFIYAVWVLRAGHQGDFSGFAAALALTIILLPTVTRTTEEVLRLVPGGLREASMALGASEARTTWSVVLPSARSGIVTALLLGVALTVGETAPVIFTAFFAHATNANALHGPQASLPTLVFELIQFPSKTQVALAYTTALVLLIVVLVLFVAARIIGGGGLRRRRTRPGRGEPVLSEPVLPFGGADLDLPFEEST